MDQLQEGELYLPPFTPTWQNAHAHAHTQWKNTFFSSGEQSYLKLAQNVEDEQRNHFSCLSLRWRGEKQIWYSSKTFKREKMIKQATNQHLPNAFLPEALSWVLDNANQERQYFFFFAFCFILLFVLFFKFVTDTQNCTYLQSPVWCFNTHRYHAMIQLRVIFLSSLLFMISVWWKN